MHNHVDGGLWMHQNTLMGLGIDMEAEIWKWIWYFVRYDVYRLVNQSNFTLNTHPTIHYTSSLFTFTHKPFPFPLSYSHYTLFFYGNHLQIWLFSWDSLIMEIILASKGGHTLHTKIHFSIAEIVPLIKVCISTILTSRAIRICNPSGMDCKNHGE